MMRQEITTIVSGHFRKAAQVIKDDSGLEITGVKLFRAEVKKLRAFLTLLGMETSDEVHFALPKKMRLVYTNMGTIAKLHFHLNNIKKYCESYSSMVPVLYLQKMQQDLDFWKDNTKELLKPGNNFEKDKKSVISFIPGEVRTVTIQRFMEYSSHELQRLHYHLDDEESLQNIKKLLEDIANNWLYIQSCINTLPGNFSQVDKINERIKMLGDFHKNCIDIALLRLNADNALAEKEILEQAEEYLTAQNNSLKQMIYSKLN